MIIAIIAAVLFVLVLTAAMLRDRKRRRAAAGLEGGRTSVRTTEDAKAQSGRGVQIGGGPPGGH